MLWKNQKFYWYLDAWFRFRYLHDVLQVLRLTIQILEPQPIVPIDWYRLLLFLIDNRNCCRWCYIREHSQFDWEECIFNFSSKSGPVDEPHQWIPNQICGAFPSGDHPFSFEKRHLFSRSRCIVKLPYQES